MGLLNDKARFRLLIKPYLKLVKTKFGEISGQFIGSADTFAGLPTLDIDGTTIDVGDVASLTQKDGAYESGIYRWDGAQYVLFQQFDGLSDMVASMTASQAEVDAATINDKFVTPATGGNAYAFKAGSSAQKFSAAQAEEETDEVVTANQFVGTITDAEATTDYDGA